MHCKWCGKNVRSIGHFSREHGSMLRRKQKAGRKKQKRAVTPRGKPSKNPGRPPKKWFRKMFRKVDGLNPPAVVGHIWYHVLTESKRRSIRRREASRYAEKKR